MSAPWGAAALLIQRPAPAHLGVSEEPAPGRWAEQGLRGWGLLLRAPREGFLLVGVWALLTHVLLLCEGGAVFSPLLAPWPPPWRRAERSQGGGSEESLLSDQSTHTSHVPS